MIIARFIASIEPPASADQRPCIERMAKYLGRSNLWPAAWRRDEHGELVFIFANEAERYAFTMTELQAILGNLQRGVALDWQQLRRLR